MKPNVEEWYEELTEEYSVKNIVFFGDFHGNSIEKELPRLEKITKNVVHTASTKDGVDKDFTDFIILDAIYREAANPGGCPPQLCRRRKMSLRQSLCGGDSEC